MRGGSLKKTRLLLIDTNVVIYLFELGIWDKFVESCDVHMEKTIIEQCKYYEDDNGDRKPIDLSAYVKRGNIVEETTELTELVSLKDRFGADIIERLHSGEAEALALLTERNPKFLICSSDPIVFRVLAALGMSEQGLALETVLQGIGLRRSVDSQYTEKYRRMYLKRGFQEGLQGLASLK